MIVNNTVGGEIGRRVRLTSINIIWNGNVSFVIVFVNQEENFLNIIKYVLSEQNYQKIR